MNIDVQRAQILTTTFTLEMILLVFDSIGI